MQHTLLVPHQAPKWDEGGSRIFVAVVVPPGETF